MKQGWIQKFVIVSIQFLYHIHMYVPYSETSYVLYPTFTGYFVSYNTHLANGNPTNVNQALVCVEAIFYFPHRFLINL